MFGLNDVIYVKHLDQYSKHYNQRSKHYDQYSYHQKGWLVSITQILTGS